jgi:hypothetical protein
MSEGTVTEIRSIWYGQDSYQCEQCHEVCHVPSGCNGPMARDTILNSFFSSHHRCQRPKQNTPLHELYKPLPKP